MPRKWVPALICKNAVWKETAIRLKHIRTYSANIDEYNESIWPLLELFRKTEKEICNWQFLSKFEYRDKIKELNIKDFQKE